MARALGLSAAWLADGSLPENLEDHVAALEAENRQVVRMFALHMNDFGKVFQIRRK